MSHDLREMELLSTLLLSLTQEKPATNDALTVFGFNVVFITFECLSR